MEESEIRTYRDYVVFLNQKTKQDPNKGWCPNCGKYGLVGTSRAVFCELCNYVEAEAEE